MSESENKPESHKKENESGDKNQKNEEQEKGAGDNADAPLSENNSKEEIRSRVKSSTKKKEAKATETTEETDEDDDDEEEELKLGLLEEPIVIQSGKRERRKTERLEASISATPKDKKLTIPEGKGVKLGDCSRIDHFLNKTKSDDLKPLHKLLYNRLGTSIEVKRNIRKFCGFDFEDDSSEYKKKVASLDKLFIPVLKNFCSALDLEKKGTKEEIVQRIVSFLLQPTDSGRKLPESKRKKSKSSSSKKKASKTPNAKSATSKKKQSATSTEEEVSDISDDSSEDEHKDDQEEIQESPKKKKAAVAVKKTPAKKVATPKKTPAKSPSKKAAKKDKTPVKKTAPKKRKAADMDDTSSDEEPLSKRARSPPSDDEIKEFVKKLLAEADLEQVTMKTVVKEVYAKYPDDDLTDKKDMIKSTVRQLLA